jgi:hypothetical protein
MSLIMTLDHLHNSQQQRDTLLEGMIPPALSACVTAISNVMSGILYEFFFLKKNEMK